MGLKLLGKKKLIKYEDGTDDVQITGDLVVSGAQTLQGGQVVTGANGSAFNVKTLTVTHSTVSGTGTETVTGVIPAGAKLLSLTARVTTILAGAALTTWSLGDGTDVDRWGTGLALAAGTTVDQGDATADPAGTWAATARNLVMTAAVGVFTTGAVEFVIFYHDDTAPTS